METIGIIAEYNPFHNGHIYHIKKIKEQFPDATIIAVIGTCFTQRGDISILNKWDKTKLALLYGIDLVVELPYFYASQSADFFAEGAIKILNALKVNKIIFGSESNNINFLKEQVRQQLEDQNINENIKKNLKEGKNYPTALKEATTNEQLYSNDILAISYIKEIIKNNYKIEPLTIKRTNNYYDNNPNNQILSATGIRKLLKENKNIENYVPKETINLIYKETDPFIFLKYKILTEQNNLDKYLTVTEGIEKRILKYINDANNTEELIKLIKTKRYTYNRINRMLNHILTSFTNELRNNLTLDYIRVLGFNKKGQEYLKNIKKECEFQIITKYEKDKYPMSQYEYQITELYAFLINDKDLIKRELKKPIILK